MTQELKYSSSAINPPHPHRPWAHSPSSPPSSSHHHHHHHRHRIITITTIAIIAIAATSRCIILIFAIMDGGDAVELALMDEGLSWTRS
jgi:hypothetical protein